MSSPLKKPWKGEAAHGVQSRTGYPNKFEVGQIHHAKDLHFPSLLSATQPQTKPNKPGPPKSRQRRRPSITESSHIRLLPDLLRQSHSASETERLRNYVKELDLSPSASSPEQVLAWKVGTESISNLELPPRKCHSGDFQWIGKEPDAIPAYLWDSLKTQTVEATPDILHEGYIAVSWSWGRFQEKVGKRTRQSGGTNWHVPVINEGGAKGEDLVHDLKACLRKMKHRYFWVDVLCINQKNQEEKKREIAKQAKIFASAEGVIAYLWTLETADALAQPLMGLKHLLSWALVFGRCEAHRSYFIRERVRASTRMDNSFTCPQFEALRTDYWFTSLWALQEIVLAPAGVWMTRYGHICRLNDHVLTTRVFAMIIRLLSWSEKRRSEYWHAAHNNYRKRESLSEDEFEKMLAMYQSYENGIREQLSCDLNNHLTKYQTSLPPPIRSSARSSPLGSPFASLKSSWMGASTWSDDTGHQGIVVEVTMPLEDPPWLIKRYVDDEEILRLEIRKWTMWAFGTACIDVSLSATRAAILVAGRNRDIVKGNSREEALLAALKVEPDPSFLTSSNAAQKERKHLSPSLINVLLEAEGPKLFNVAHGFLRRDNRHNPQSTHHGFDETEWVLTEPDVNFFVIKNIPNSPYCLIDERSDRPKMKAEYLQRGRKKFIDVLSGGLSLLTDMSPDTASRMNPQVLHFAAEADYAWASGLNWHMHPTGALHIPKGQPTQRIPQKVSKFDIDFCMQFRPNGSEEEYEIRSRSDLKLICNTQPWLLSLLKDPQGSVLDLPRFLFLPLGIRRTSPSQPSLEDETQPSREVETSSSEPAVIGVVLVTTKAKKETVSVWYKFGTYAAYCSGNQLTGAMR
jgi:hypothetical protein